MPKVQADLDVEVRVLLLAARRSGPSWESLGEVAGDSHDLRNLGGEAGGGVALPVREAAGKTLELSGQHVPSPGFVGGELGFPVA